MAIFASLAFPGAALATTGGPVNSELETGRISGVGQRGITAGPDGNLWFTEETHNAVDPITPGRSPSSARASRPAARGDRHRPRRQPVGRDGGGQTARSPVSQGQRGDQFDALTAGTPEDIAVGPDNNLWYVDSAANLIGRINPDGSIMEFADGLTTAPRRRPRHRGLPA